MQERDACHCDSDWNGAALPPCGPYKERPACCLRLKCRCRWWTVLLAIFLGLILAAALVYPVLHRELGAALPPAELLLPEQQTSESAQPPAELSLPEQQSSESAQPTSGESSPYPDTSGRGAVLTAASVAVLALGTAAVVGAEKKHTEE
ncbi:MAG: hypothetical protein LBG83_02515 [Oscillospiraceae bacterium]|jgi:hypothetical protein|nr:hypothetical protein [Oscillospiraceae bacterium]